MRLDTERSLLELEQSDVVGGVGELFHSFLLKHGEEVRFSWLQDPGGLLGSDGRRAVFNLERGVLVVEGSFDDSGEHIRVWKAGQEGQVRGGIPGQSEYLEIHLTEVGIEPQVWLMEERGLGRRPRLAGGEDEAEQWVLGCLDGQE